MKVSALSTTIANGLLRLKQSAGRPTILFHENHENG